VLFQVHYISVCRWCVQEPARLSSTVVAKMLRPGVVMRNSGIACRVLPLLVFATACELSASWRGSVVCIPSRQPTLWCNFYFILFYYSHSGPWPWLGWLGPVSVFGFGFGFRPCRLVTMAPGPGWGSWVLFPSSGSGSGSGPVG
jgi:hypothetical protein